MSTQKDDGGPAFPRGTKLETPTCSGIEERRRVNALNEQTDGMTLRDWFAGQALSGIMAHPVQHPDDASASGVASLCYDLADAMIAARKEGGA
jgi:hypothetical protein